MFLAPACLFIKQMNVLKLAFKYKTTLSILTSLMVVLAINFIAYPYGSYWFYVGCFVIYLTTALLTYLSIWTLSEKHLKAIQSMSCETMMLDSQIGIIECEGKLISRFTLKNDRLRINFTVESKKGICGHSYDQLNIDSIMIKPNKAYNISILTETRYFQEVFASTESLPVSIDYYNLQDSLFSFKITTLKAQAED